MLAHTPSYACPNRYAWICSWLSRALICEGIELYLDHRRQGRMLGHMITSHHGLCTTSSAVHGDGACEDVLSYVSICPQKKEWIPTSSSVVWLDWAIFYGGIKPLWTRTQNRTYLSCLTILSGVRGMRTHATRASYGLRIVTLEREISSFSLARKVARKNFLSQGPSR